MNRGFPHASWASASLAHLGNLILTSSVKLACYSKLFVLINVFLKIPWGWRAELQLQFRTELPGKHTSKPFSWVGQPHCIYITLFPYCDHIYLKYTLGTIANLDIIRLAGPLDSSQLGNHKNILCSFCYGSILWMNCSVKMTVCGQSFWYLYSDRLRSQKQWWHWGAWKLCGGWRTMEQQTCQEELQDQDGARWEDLIHDLWLHSVTRPERRQCWPF